MGTCQTNTSIKATNPKDIKAPPVRVVIKENAAKIQSKTGPDAENGKFGQKQTPLKVGCKKHAIVMTTAHEHYLERVKDFMEPWLCSGAQENDGCQSFSPEFLPGMSPQAWMCKECVYFMCKPCILFYISKDEKE